MVPSGGLSLCCSVLLRISGLQACGCIFWQGTKTLKTPWSTEQCSSKVPVLTLTLFPKGALLDPIFPAFLTWTQLMPLKFFQYLHSEILCSALGISQTRQMLHSSEWLYLHCIFILDLSPGLWLHTVCYFAQIDLSCQEGIQIILPECGRSPPCALSPLLPHAQTLIAEAGLTWEV